jgi:hypothetical protein
MAISSKTKLQERVPLGRTAWKLADVSVLSLLLALVAHRAGSLLGSDDEGVPPPWYRLAALACEAWFTLVWILNMNAKWNPARFDTFPERVAERSVLVDLVRYGVGVRVWLLSMNEEEDVYLFAVPQYNTHVALLGPTTSCRRWTCS